MRKNAVRWLLLLGSSRAADTLLHEALHQLGELHGAARLLTPIRRFPADDGSDLAFYNALAEWTPADDRLDAQARIRQIEAALGRDRSRDDEVAIDIDVLARFTHGQWRAHPHALDKHEFARPLVRGLLQQAGVDVVCRTPPPTPDADEVGSDVQ
jgi:7,8-dihydro-6-hydroxymethylpterin-pyrophosphokinase